MTNKPAAIDTSLKKTTMSEKGKKEKKSSLTC